MVVRYKKQDIGKNRDVEGNVKEEDYDKFRVILENSKCHMCNEVFSDVNRPTLDRIDNDLGHSKENVKPCCLFCNRIKSDKDENAQKLYIQLRKYAIKNHLPMTLCEGQENLYRFIRSGIVGGLSNVHHRENIRGKTVIQKLFHNELIDDIDLLQTDQKNIVSNILGVDFNSLYPSAYSSIKHPCNPYTEGIIYIPGNVKFHSTNKDQILKIINEKKELFACKVKGYIPRADRNKPTTGAISETANFVNFFPIFMNIDVKTDEKTIGSPMYKYMKEHNFPTDKKERKLTQLMDTNNEYRILITIISGFF
jgi:hypothetical protein